MIFNLKEVSRDLVKFRREHNLDNNDLVAVTVGKRQVMDIRDLTYMCLTENPFVNIEKLFNIKIAVSEKDSLIELSISE